MILEAEQNPQICSQQAGDHGTRSDVVLSESDDLTTRRADDLSFSPQKGED